MHNIIIKILLNLRFMFKDNNIKQIKYRIKNINNNNNFNKWINIKDINNIMLILNKITFKIKTKIDFKIIDTIMIYLVIFITKINTLLYKLQLIIIRLKIIAFPEFKIWN